MLLPLQNGTAYMKKVLFNGSKEKLQRFVQRENGKTLGDQRFYVDVKNKYLKQHRAFPFRFRCKYQKTEKGYEVGYFILPAPFGFVRMAIWCILAGIFVYVRQLNPLLVFGFLAIAYFINYFCQRSQCIRQFETACSQ